MGITTKTVNKVNAGTKKIIIVEYFSTNADVMFFFIIQKK